MRVTKDEAVVIKIVMEFPDFRAAAVALAKMNEGQQLLAEHVQQETTAGKPAEDDRPKRGRKAADEKAAEPPKVEKPAETAKTASDDDDPFGMGGEKKADDKPSASDYDSRLAAFLKDNEGKAPLDFLRVELKRIVDKHGMEDTKAFMSAFGHPRITEVPAEKYPALLAKIDKAAGAAKVADAFKDAA